jgi:alpha-beta hydrolase superfamily lysophospholipase
MAYRSVAARKSRAVPSPAPSLDWTAVELPSSYARPSEPDQCSPSNAAPAVAPQRSARRNGVRPRCRWTSRGQSSPAVPRERQRGAGTHGARRATRRRGVSVPPRQDRPQVLRSHHRSRHAGVDRPRPAHHPHDDCPMGGRDITSAGRRPGRASEFGHPLRVLLGTSDPIASASAGCAFFESARSVDKEVRQYEGYLHELFNEPRRQQPILDAVSWIAARAERKDPLGREAPPTRERGASASPLSAPGDAGS